MKREVLHRSTGHISARGGRGRGFTCLPEIWQWVGSGANSAIKAYDQDANLL